MTTRDERLTTYLELEGGAPVLRLCGEVDVNTSVQFQESLEVALGDGCNRLLLDFSGVTFMDSSGLGVLIYVLRGLNEDGGRELWAAQCNPQVHDLLEATHLNRQIKTFRTLEVALGAWDSPESEGPEDHAAH